MTIAEVHGKIGHSGRNLSDRMEDLLTSDVFSACKYLKPETLIIPFLRQASWTNGSSLSDILRENVTDVRYVFWPRLSRSEPDVLIVIELLSGQFIIVLVEAKYYSSKSSSALGEEELEIAETPSDQLAREYMDLMESYNYLQIPKSKVSANVLIYLTVHRSIPTDSLEESIHEINKFHPEGNINLFWLSWFELYPIISQKTNVSDWEKPIVEDLIALLERKGFVHFNGYRLIQIEPIPVGEIFKGMIGRKIHSFEFDLVDIDNIAKTYEGGKVHD